MGKDHKLQGLQIARAIAALSVAYFHSYVAVRAAFPESAWLPIPGLKQWGYLGVDLFFAISGYVICMVASKPSFTLAGFAIKRIFRLYPMYWVAMALVAGLIAIEKYQADSLQHFLYSMTLLPQQGSSTYDVSWTLERELVFYALAALIIPIAGIPGLALSLAALSVTGWWLGNPWTFHLTGPAQSEFLAGVLVFMARRPLGRLGAIAPFAAASTLLWLGITFQFPFWAPVAVAPLLIGMLNLRLPWSRAPLRWLVQAGDASYSIYLLHYLVFYGAANVSVRVLSLPSWACEPWRFVTILATCLLSYATWRLIEQPMIRLGESVAAIAERRQLPNLARNASVTKPTTTS